MFWLPISLIAAFSLATTDALTKRFLSNLSLYEMALVWLIFTLLWLICSLFFMPLVNPDSMYVTYIKEYPVLLFINNRYNSHDKNYNYIYNSDI